MPTAAIKTLGCKLNQYESEQIREQLEHLGYAITDADSPADLYIINSCTVTHQADRDTRRLARHLKRLSPRSCVVVTGCYAEVAAQELKAIAEVDIVCGMKDKLRVGELLHERGYLAADPAGSGCASSHLVHSFAGRTRCFVKIQEGCDARCSYCIIPDARGPSRSVPVDEVTEQVRRLVEAGHPEIVLIGTHLGQFGRGLVPPSDLDALVLQLLNMTGLQRLRLSSIEPREVTPNLIRLLRSGGSALETPSAGEGAKLCRYLHIPVQSGCDAVLRRMNRPYDTSFYSGLIHEISTAQPATGLGADVIVGFPGETDEEFDQTRELLESLPLSYLHVFTYSPRSGTPAAELPGRVPHEVALRRNHILRDMSARKSQAFAGAMVGQRVEAVLQKKADNGWMRGVTDNYLQLRLKGPDALLQRLVACEVTDVQGAELVGRLI